MTRFAETRFSDHSFGLQVEKTEAALSQGLGQAGSRDRSWIGLPPNILLTPYEEIVEMLGMLNPLAGETLADLGAGYGRIAFVLHALYPGVRFVGYESVPARAREAQRALSTYGVKTAEIRNCDLELPTTEIDPAEYFFIYDFGTTQAIRAALAKLRKLAQSKPITVIGRGRSIRDEIERREPWLSAVHPVFHTANFSIYKS